MTEQELQTLAKETLDQMIAKLGFQADCTNQTTENGDQKLIVASEDARVLIGRKGQTLEAFEIILNRILKKNDENAPWFSLDIDGYTTSHDGAARDDNRHERRSRRSILDDDTIETLTHIALDAAKEVRHWKKARRLGPYLPAERRIIHTTLADDPVVTTNSIPAPEAGERMKYVEILMK